MERAFFAFCSTNRTVVPLALTFSIISKISFTKIGERPIDGSSITIIFGLDMSARPIASICCSPPDNVPALWVLRSFSLGKRLYTFSRFAAISFLSFRVYAPIIKFSYTLRSANTLRPSGTWAIPISTILWAGTFVISTPSKIMEPCFAGSNPVTVCRVVVFPAPLAPIRAITSP